ncbi:AAA family ATPase [Sandarakinorhabdus sp.]|uniref:AAA family ATPase n=1 Tax=Sandarakinorhabdus sp. TaxID=1916663 RepID=UPI003F726676
MALLARLGALVGDGSAPSGPELVEGPALRVTLVLEPATAGKLDMARLNVLNAEIRPFDGGLDAFAANAPLIRRTDMVVVEIDPENAKALAALEQFASGVGGRIPVVAAVHDLTISATRRLMRSAIADVLPIPFSLEELGQAIESGRERITQARTGDGPVRMAHIVAFQGALGGIGTSMIATQAAQLWAKDRSVLLIDMDLQRGNAALYLNLKPRLTISDLIEADDRLDGEFLKMVSERHQSGLSVVAAPADMNPLDSLTPDFIDRLMDQAAQQFDMVVLDMPGIWMDWTAAALQKADIIALVTQITVSGVQQARRQLDVFDANNLGERVRVVMNRMTPGLFGKYDLSDAESALRHRVHFALANDYPTVSAALDEGRSLSQIKMKARIEKEIRAMAAALTEEMTAMGATA